MQNNVLNRLECLRIAAGLPTVSSADRLVDAAEQILRFLNGEKPTPIAGVGQEKKAA